MVRNPAHVVVVLVATLGVLATPGSASWAQRNSARPDNSGNPGLVIVLEGLRSEFFTPSVMPNLYSMSQRGVSFESHHAVFPSLSGTNAATIATGAYPSTHGLLGNSMFFPEIDGHEAFDTNEINDLQRIQDATGGQLLTAPSLGEILRAEDRELLVISSGEPGTAFLLDPRHQDAALIHPDFTQPESLAREIIQTLGPAPRDETTPGARNAWAVDAYLDVGLTRVKADTVILWLAEPALTQSEAGLGSPRSVEAIRQVDRQIGRILKRHKELSLKVNVFVTSDTGYSTRIASKDLARFLVDEGLKAGATSPDVIVLDNASIFVAEHDRNLIKKIVQRLLKLDWVGAIYTQQSRPTHPESFVPGALSFQAVYMDHPRAPDILVEPAWSDDRNQYGYGGTVRGFGNSSSSPYDLRTILVAAGPDIKRGDKSDVPTATIDLAPTLCYLQGIEPPATMDGRVLHEALRGGPKPGSIEVLRRRHGSQAVWEGGRYRLIMTELTVDGVDYLDYTKVEGK